jgi:hypothetical protein
MRCVLAGWLLAGRRLAAACCQECSRALLLLLTVCDTPMMGVSQTVAP